MALLPTRRIFLLTLATGGSAAFAVTPVPTPGASGGAVNERDATAIALGYVADATKADKNKYPKYAAGQKCSACALYQGKSSDASGPCPIFAGKQVSAGGWCSSWVKKG